MLTRKEPSWGKKEQAGLRQKTLQQKGETVDPFIWSTDLQMDRAEDRLVHELVQLGIPGRRSRCYVRRRPNVRFHHVSPGTEATRLAGSRLTGHICLARPGQ
ncbi:hypothetical protein J3459_013495 [Metarhizium acridum]|nr:hypothetical protein J3459_013495 [Metarhizium acridum]